MNKDQYINLASMLSNEILSSVEYFEVEYDGYESSFLGNTEYDSLDYGINLKMASGKVFGFIWGSEFTQYGVSILENEIQSEVSTCRKIEVTNSKNWSSLISKKIESTEVVWQWVKEVGVFKKKTYYPQSILINFTENKSIVISVMEITDTSQWGMTDNIVVFFNKLVANKYKALNA